MSPPLPADVDEAPLAAERQAVRAFAQAALLLAGTAAERYRDRLDQEQELLLWLADVIIDVYAADSAVLRASKASASKHPAASLQADAARVFVSGVSHHRGGGPRGVGSRGRGRRPPCASRGPATSAVSGSRRDTVALRRRLADETIAKGGYLFA